MNEPEGTGSGRDRDSKEEIVLPSWIDAAITKSRDAEDPASEGEPLSLPEDAVEPMSDEPTTEEEWGADREMCLHHEQAYRKVIPRVMTKS